MKKYSLHGVFIITLLGTFGSLYFSAVLNYAPCSLCWYQRAILYPLLLISLVGILRQDPKAYTYILPLSIIGSAVALFHNLLYWGIVPETVLPCLNGVSCTDKYLELYGFITIPFMSLIAFLVITGLMYISFKNNNK